MINGTVVYIQSCVYKPYRKNNMLVLDSAALCWRLIMITIASIPRCMLSLLKLIVQMQLVDDMFTNSKETSNETY